MTAIDLHASVAVAVVLACIAVGYAARVVFEGRAVYARVKAAGPSPLLGTAPLEMVYWALQPIARACVALGVSANAVTQGSLALGGLAGVALAFGHFGVGAALATVSAIGDALDGLVARMGGTVSKRGAIVDAAADRYEEAFFLGGLGIYFHADTGKLALVFGALVGSFMVSYGSAKADALGKAAPRGAMRRLERAAVLTVGAAFSSFTWALSQGTPVAGWASEAPMLLALGLVAVIANVSAVRRLVAIAADAGDTVPPASAALSDAKGPAYVGSATARPALRDTLGWQTR